jgi:hypothetical protein
MNKADRAMELGRIAIILMELSKAKRDIKMLEMAETIADIAQELIIVAQAEAVIEKIQSAYSTKVD